MSSNKEKIKVAIAEDEDSTRQLIQSYLEFFAQVEVVAAVKSGEELVDAVKKFNPEAVFIDIKMPEINGLSVAALLKEIKKEICIIFVTAYPDYAADAFQIDAVDYLVKPITKERIGKAINKIEKLLMLDKDSRVVNDFLILKNNHEIYFIKYDDIFFIEKEFKKTVVHTVNGKYATTETLGAVEKKLNHDFFRCHKSFIINLKKLEKITPIADRTYKLTFHNYHNYATMCRKKLDELYNILLTRGDEMCH